MANHNYINIRFALLAEFLEEVAVCDSSTRSNHEQHIAFQTLLFVYLI